MISLKKGVSIQGLRPELLLAMLIAVNIFKAQGAHLVITCICDGKHSETSLHYTGCAFDCRIRNISEPRRTVIFRKLKEALGSDFDVVLEKTHIHIEYQPRFKS